MKEEVTKLHIHRSNDRVTINFCDSKGNTVLYNMFFKEFDNDIFYDIDQIVKISKFFHKDTIYVYVSGDGCKELFDEICYYLDNSELKIEYQENQKNKKEKILIKKDEE